AGVVVIGTVRRAQLEELTPTGDLRNPNGEALNDGRLVRRVDWELAWSETERAAVAAVVHHPPLLEAVKAGTPVGAFCVAGPELVKRLKDARANEERPYRYWLPRTVVDWYRTGIGRPLPVAEAKRLVATLSGDAELDDDEFDKA